MSNNIWMVEKFQGNSGMNDSDRFFSSKKKAIAYVEEKIEFITNHWSLGVLMRNDAYKECLTIGIDCSHPAPSGHSYHVWIIQARTVY